MESIGGERVERYHGHTLQQVDWYFAAKRDGRTRFTATTPETLRYMIDVAAGHDANHHHGQHRSQGNVAPCCA